MKDILSKRNETSSENHEKESHAEYAEEKIR